MNLQARISTALAARQGLTQAGLARSCGISRASVNAWVRGPTDSIDGKYLTTAAAYLGVNPHWLATGNGEMLAVNTPPPAQASNVEPVAGGEASVEALVDALASTLNAFETLAQREVVAERLRALAFYPDSAKARAEVVQVLSCPPSATAGQSGAPTHQAPGITPALQQLFQRKAVTQTADFATPPPAVAPPDEPPSRALQNKTGQK